MSEQTSAASPLGDASDPTAPMPGGNRAIDRILGEGYLADLASRPLAQVRELRAEADQEEADLSYLRRMLQGRLDIVRAELARRANPEAGGLVDALPGILAEQTRAPARGLGRHPGVEPQRVAPSRRRLEALAHDADVSDVGSRSAEELHEAMERLATEEERVSSRRCAVQQVVDRCGAEITRRYREGEADVADLLGER
jgi:hypothetical protein